MPVTNHCYGDQSNEYGTAEHVACMGGVGNVYYTVKAEGKIMYVRLRK